MKSPVTIATALSAAASTAHAGSCAATCSVESFNGVLPAGATVLSAVKVSGNGTYGEGAANVAYPRNPSNLPELCALIVNATSSSSSSYRFGLFLPTQWNDRFLAVGNGGFAGGINWLDMGAGVAYGFAVMSTDTGHNSTSQDLNWSQNQPEKKTDFGYRAMHGSVTLAKTLTEFYYAKEISYSYYRGCSTGGRQGLKELQLYPDSFDGVLAGAPAWWTTHLQTWTTKVATYNLPSEEPKNIPSSLFPVLAAEVIKQCDEVDGLKDGIVSTPEACKFDFAPISCESSTANASACFTAAQVQTAKNIYSDYYADGELAFHGFSLGTEAQWATLVGPQPNPLGEKYVGIFLLDDLNWTYQQYNDSLVGLADELDPGNCSADGYDMSAFKARGGKLLIYHGHADPAIPTKSSNIFYEKVTSAMGGVDNLQDWFRFFLVPGMSHCSGTTVNAPWYFGGGNQAGSIGTDIQSTPGAAYRDAEHDALLALMEWVENDKPVDQIVATTWKSTTVPSSGVLRQRPICPYPQQATYDGTGNVDAAESWKCT